MPPIISKLEGLLPQAGEKRYIREMGSGAHQSRAGDVNRRYYDARERNLGRGRGRGRDRVRFDNAK